MLLMPIVLPDRPPWGAVAVALDKPGAVVALDEAGHGLTELIDGVVQGGPPALVLEGPDPALSAAVGLRLTQERRAVADAQPGHRAGEVAERYCGPSHGGAPDPGEVWAQLAQRSMTA